LLVHPIVEKKQALELTVSFAVDTPDHVGKTRYSRQSAASEA